MSVIYTQDQRDIPQHFEQGVKYRLTWSSNPNALYLLLSWDHAGNCKMRSSTGKEFITQTKHIRKG